MTVQANAALARKLSAGQDGVPEPPRSILRALRLGLARSAGEGLGLPLSVIGAKQATRAQPELADRVPDGWLLLMFTTEQAGAAAICLDPGCVSAIVQQQTIGMVTSGSPSDRVFTDTDAAMAAPLLEDMMSRARGLVETSVDITNLSGIEYASRAEDMRTLMLAMVDERYRVADLTVELAGGVRQGELCIMLPELPLAEDEKAGQETVSDRSLDQASGVMQAELHVVLSRISLPLTALSGLTPGDVLPLTGSKLDKVEILTIDRVKSAIGRLGQSGGMRAVRINESQPTTAPPPTEPPPFLASRSETFHEADQERSPPDEITEVDDLESQDHLHDLVEAEDALPISSAQMATELAQIPVLSARDEES